LKERRNGNRQWGSWENAIFPSIFFYTVLNLRIIIIIQLPNTEISISNQLGWQGDVWGTGGNGTQINKPTYVTNE
jgi:hypothetical protein